MATKPALSVVVPTLNEEQNIDELIKRLQKVLSRVTYQYEIIFIDDQSTDNTVMEIQKYRANLPIRVLRKVGEPGKSFSLLQGFGLCRYDFIAMIDADLQYPPEIISRMLKKLVQDNVDIIVGNRKINQAQKLRGYGTKAIGLLHRFLFGLNFDVQSGLKLFRKQILESMEFHNVRPWTLDLDLLWQAKQIGYRIESVDLTFSSRLYGESKVSIFHTGLEISSYALKTRFTSIVTVAKRHYDYGWLGQIVRFSLVGVTNTGVDISIYLLLTRFIGLQIITAKALSYSVATLNSFILNRRFTFRQSNTSTKMLVPFALVSVVGLGLNSATLYIATSLWHFSDIFGLLLATGAVFTWGFTVSKFYIFKPDTVTT